ncbi:class I glutamine amidotransferase-like protein [Dactylonectria estremocensis]|uniref:Class I glutamine amidotransferase-like protein n=1 Tax=Dactylonectria estremocensis TaxID=1079267 RepID=A0A9P9DWR5_9HYPO|nr:class I glutamine amidotransferase-like protein [Dactylonectria estremocensis]
MTLSKHVISVAVFNCGYTAPSIQNARGQFHEIFAALLTPALERVCHNNLELPNVTLDIKGWDTVNQEYPPTLDKIDAIIVTGSPNGAYEDLEWIRTLDRHLADIYRRRPSIKMYGSCFGHQIICQALFKDQGAAVAKDPSGWELGVHTINASDEFLERFSSLLPSEALRIQFLHADHVIFTNGSVPRGIHLIGSTSQCQNQGIYQPGRILTLQGHPEFDQFITTECLKLVGQRVGWEEEFRDAAVASATVNDDAAIAANIIVAFFLGLDVTNT